MDTLISSLPHLSQFLDYDKLIKGHSIVSFQGRLRYLVDQITIEVRKLKATNDPKAIDQLLEIDFKQANEYSGGDLATINPMVNQIFQLEAYDLDTNLDNEDIPIRKILTWAKDSSWSYNEQWEQYCKDHPENIPFYMTGNTLRHFLFGLLFQSTVNALTQRLSLSGLQPMAKKRDKSVLHSDDEYYTVQEVADLLKITKGTVHNYANQGLITRYKLSQRKTLFKKSEILEKLDSLREIKGKRQSDY